MEVSGSNRYVLIARGTRRAKSSLISTESAPPVGLIPPLDASAQVGTWVGYILDSSSQVGTWEGDILDNN